MSNKLGTPEIDAELKNFRFGSVITEGASIQEAAVSKIAAILAQGIINSDITLEDVEEFLTTEVLLPRDRIFELITANLAPEEARKRRSNIQQVIDIGEARKRLRPRE